jgi:hypothetical protein
LAAGYWLNKTSYIAEVVDNAPSAPKGAITLRCDRSAERCAAQKRGSSEANQKRALLKQLKNLANIRSSR